jgi:hypothetical protein
MLAPAWIEPKRLWANLEVETPTGVITFRGFPKKTLASMQTWCNERL